MAILPVIREIMAVIPAGMDTSTPKVMTVLMMIVTATVIETGDMYEFYASKYR